MICASFVAFVFLILWHIPNVRCTSANDISTEMKETVLLPINKIKGFKLSKHIPSHCEELRICDDVDNYPETRINDIIDKLKIKKVYFHTEECTMDGNDDFQRSRDLCTSEIKCLSPKAVKVETGKWYLVLNTKKSPVQNFTGQICEKNKGCSKVITHAKSTSCEQIYFERPMLVLNTRMDAVIIKNLPVPCCCKCHIHEEWVQEETKDDR